MLSTRTFYFLGALFVATAAVLTVRQLDLGAGYNVSILLVGLFAAAMLLKNTSRVAMHLLFTVAAVVPSVFYLVRASHTDWLVAIAVAAVASIILVLHSRSVWMDFDMADHTKQAANLESGAVWVALTFTTLGLFWAFYFHFLTSLNDNFIERRLIFTLFLILVGIVLSIIGRNRPQPFLSLLGLSYLGVGVAKAIVYDTTHLGGFLRIAVFAGGGLLLLAGGALMNKKPAHA